MEKSSFFNSVNKDRKYKAEDWAEYFSSFIGNGIFPNPSNNLMIEVSSGMTLKVNVGKAWINGYFYYNTDDFFIVLDNPDGVLKRIDRIVLRWDKTERKISVEVKKGTFASQPVAPDLQRDADAYEIGLADIFIDNGVVNLSQSSVTDLRQNKAYCGLVTGTVNQIDGTGLFSQYDSIFNDWFENIKETLDGDVAASLAADVLELQNEVSMKASDERVDSLETNQGDLVALQTSNKSNLVGAMNEVKGTVDSMSNDLSAAQDKISNIRNYSGKLLTGIVSGSNANVTVEGNMVFTDGDKLDVKFNADVSAPVTVSFNSGTQYILKDFEGNEADVSAEQIYTLIYKEDDVDFFFCAPKGGAKITKDQYRAPIFLAEDVKKNDPLEIYRGNATKALYNTDYQSATSMSISTVDTDGYSYAEKLDQSRVLILYRNGTTYMPTVHVGVVNPVAGSYSMGTEVIVESTSTNLVGLVVLSSTKAVAVYGTGVVRARVLNISGTDVTLGNEVYTIGTQANNMVAHGISDDSFALFYREGDAGSYAVKATVVGDVITFGTIRNWQTDWNVNLKLLRIDDSKAIIVYLVYNSPGIRMETRLITFSSNDIFFNDAPELIYTSADYYTYFGCEWLTPTFDFLVVWEDDSVAQQAIKIDVDSNYNITLNSIVATGSFGDIYDTAPLNGQTIIVSRNSSHGILALNVLSDTNIRAGRAVYQDSNSYWKQLIPFNGLNFLQVHTVPKTPLHCSFAEALKYVSAIALTDGLRHTEIECLIL